MILTNQAIKQAMTSGDIVIHPFNEARLNNASYDIALGRYVARIPKGVEYVDLNTCQGSDVFQIEDLKKTGGKLYLRPGERVLAHSHEWIGSRQQFLPIAKARSSSGRWGITACLCAGFGDVGYHNRWTLEVKNLNEFEVSVMVGTPIAQICFYEAGEIEAGTTYAARGSYQTGTELQTLISAWEPEQMLPKRMATVQWEPQCPADERE